jgi:hypothetical protein
MKLTKIIVLMAGFSFWQTQATAETLDVEYKSFYSHVNKLDNPETDALRFAFGFLHIDEKRLCHISSAKIVTQKQTLPLALEKNQRFTVPSDKILKMARAKVIIELNDQANKCDMSVQLETLPRFLKTQYTQGELILLFNQYEAFFDKMGSFMSFMMPSAQGLLFYFDENVSLPESLKVLVDKNGALALSKSWLMQQKNLTLTKKPIRITAIVKK